MHLLPTASKKIFGSGWDILLRKECWRVPIFNPKKQTSETQYSYIWNPVEANFLI